MPYTFSEIHHGCVITDTRDSSVQVSLTLHDTAIAVASARSGLCQAFGLFDYYALAQWVVRRLLEGQLDLDTPRWKEAWLIKITGQRIGIVLHQQWKRLLALAEPTVVAVQRAIFAATFRAPDILHDPALYRDSWIVHDIVTYRAAAIAAAQLEPHKRSCTIDYPFHEPQVMDEAALATYLAQQQAQPTTPASTAGDKRPVYPVELLGNWRGLFSPTGEPYTSLNKTLMHLPRVPSRLLPQLCKVRLDHPITHWLELLLILTHLAACHAPTNDQHHRVYMHARPDQIREAMRRIAMHIRTDLRPARAQDVSVLVGLLSDYPHPHRGTIVGLAHKSIDWHRHAQERYQAQILAMLGGEQPTARPPIALPDDSAIRFLATVGDIVAEGTAMEHCISSYAEAAAQGQCYLFHIEHDGEQASVEVGADGLVIQAYGPRNQRNTAAAWGARMLNRWGRQFPPFFAQTVGESNVIGRRPLDLLLDDIVVPF